MYFCCLFLLVFPFFTATFVSSTPLKVIEISNGTIIFNNHHLDIIAGKVPPDTEVAVIAIAGEFRKGKSFFLNFFLQYLAYRANSLPSPPMAANLNHLRQMIETQSHPWMRDVDNNNGFHFRSGNQRDTSGIMIWSEPFVIKNHKTGKDMAVLVIDSQGLYDAETDHNDNVRIFTIVSLLSSHLLLNTPQNINLRHLTELHYFMQYATIDSTVAPAMKPFQRLTFLIRDYTLDEKHGWSGGKDVLDKFMSPDQPYQPQQLRQLAKNLTKGFEKIDAFALPLPGPQVIRKDFDGSLSRIDIDFLHNVEHFVMNATESLDPRQTFSSVLTAGKLGRSVDEIVTILNAKLPPDELMRMNDREAVIAVFFQIQSLVHEYEKKMQQPINPQPDSYYLRKDVSQVMDDIRSMHQDAWTQITDRFERSEASNFRIPFGLNRTTITAVEWLQRQIDDRFQVMMPQLHLLTETRIQQALINKERQEAMDKEKQRSDQLDELKKKIEESRKRYEAHMVEQNNIERNRREKSFWDQLFEFFKVALTAVLNYMANNRRD